MPLSLFQIIYFFIPVLIIFLFLSNKEHNKKFILKNIRKGGIMLTVILFGYN